MREIESLKNTARILKVAAQEQNAIIAKLPMGSRGEAEAKRDQYLRDAQGMLDEATRLEAVQ